MDISAINVDLLSDAALSFQGVQDQINFVSNNYVPETVKTVVEYLAPVVKAVQDNSITIAKTWTF